jgi:hypothetical protein
MQVPRATLQADYKLLRSDCLEVRPDFPEGQCRSTSTPKSKVPRNDESY